MKYWSSLSLWNPPAPGLGWWPHILLGSSRRHPSPSIQWDDTNQTVVTANMSSTLLIALAEIEWNLLSLSEASLVWLYRYFVAKIAKISRFSIVKWSNDRDQCKSRAIATTTARLGETAYQHHTAPQSGSLLSHKPGPATDNWMVPCYTMHEGFCVPNMSRMSQCPHL